MAEVKDKLGEKAAELLSALISQAEAQRFRQLYIALLGGIGDPKAENTLLGIAGSDSASEDRCLAICGLARLNSMTGWITVQKLWESSDDFAFLKSPDGLKSLGLFGVRAYPLLLSEAEKRAALGLSETQVGAALWYLKADDALEELWKSAESHPSEKVRSAALQGLRWRTSPDACRRYYEALISGTSPWKVEDLKGQLIHAIRSGALSAPGAEVMRGTLLSNIDSLPPEVKLSLYVDSKLEAHLPTLDLNQVKPDSHQALQSFIAILCQDPRRHNQLLALLQNKAYGDRGALSMCVTYLRKNPPFQDKDLADALTESIAHSDPSETGSFMALLSMAQPELQARATEIIAGKYTAIAEDIERVRYIASVQDTGSLGTPLLLQLIEKEHSPLARIGLIESLMRGKDVLRGEYDTEVIKDRIAQDWKQIRTGNELGVTYAFVHPNGPVEGLKKYAILARNLYSLLGTQESIEEIRSFGARLILPPYATRGDTGKEEKLRSEIQSIVSESIDIIRSRKP